MAIEYKNGEIGEVKPLKDQLKDLGQMQDLSEIKALHIGTEEELKKMKSRSLFPIKPDQGVIKEEISELKNRMDRLEENKLTSAIIKIPTKKEISNILNRKEHNE